MVDTFRRFPDVQRVLVDDLEALAGAGHTGAQTPADLAGSLPFVRVMRVGGPSGLVNDHPIVDVDVFDATYTAAESLAERIRQHLVGPPPPPWALDRIECEVGPRELPWGDGSVRRLNATYSITARRRRSG